MDESDISLDNLDVGQSSDGVDLDEIRENLGEGEYGPALMDKTPLIGEVRRQNDMPVLRDELRDQL